MPLPNHFFLLFVAFSWAVTMVLGRNGLGFVCVFYISGAPEGSSDSGSGEARDRTCGPLFTSHRAYPLHKEASNHFFTWRN